MIIETIKTTIVNKIVYLSNGLALHIQRTSVLTFIMLLLLFSIPVFSFSVYAADPVASLSGPKTAQAGETISIRLIVTGQDISSVKGEIHYDSRQLSYKSDVISLNGWTIPINHSVTGKITFEGNDNGMVPINGSEQIFEIKFQVKSQIATGTQINLSTTNLSISIQNKALSVADYAFSLNVSTPSSKVNDLGELKINNATLVPAFSKEIVNYTVAIPYAISSLDISAVALDSNAQVLIDGNTALAAGKESNVNVTVTSQSQEKKTYTIKVTRAQNPEYKISNNSSLSELSVEGYSVSPVFSPTTISYEITVPITVNKVNVIAKPEDDKASIKITGGESLIPGYDNEVKVICTAEDGAKKEYLITIRQTTSGTAIASHASRADSVMTKPIAGIFSRIPLWVVILVAAGCILLGFGAWYFRSPNMGRLNAEEEEDSAIYF